MKYEIKKLNLCPSSQTNKIKLNTKFQLFVKIKLKSSFMLLRTGIPFADPRVRRLRNKKRCRKKTRRKRGTDIQSPRSPRTESTNTFKCIMLAGTASWRGCCATVWAATRAPSWSPASARATPTPRRRWARCATPPGRAASRTSRSSTRTPRTRCCASTSSSCAGCASSSSPARAASSRNRKRSGPASAPGHRPRAPLRTLPPPSPTVSSNSLVLAPFGYI